MKKLLQSTIIVISASLLIRLTGFVREVVLAYSYGADKITDAFVIASSIPATVISFISASAASVFIPRYLRVEDSGKNRFVSNILSLFVILGLVFAVVFTVIPQSLVFLFASQLEPDSFALAVTFLRVMIWASVPILTAQIFQAYLQIHNAFLSATISSGLINISIIMFLIMSKAFNALPLMAIGSVAGNALCMLMLYVSSRKHGLRYRPHLNLRDSNIKEMLVMIAPVFVSIIISDINQIVDRNFASSLASGAVSSLNYANKVTNLVTMFLGASIATVLFPKMSQLAAEDDTKSLKRYLSGCVSKLIPLLLPIVTGIVILAEPIVRIIFERGAFSPEDTKRTAECLRMYALCLFAGNMNPILIRAYYSIHNTKTPAFISIASVVLNIMLNIALIRPLQHQGLALATAIASTFSLVLLLITIGRKLGALKIFTNKSELAKNALATVLMGAAACAGYRVLPVMSGSYIQCIAYTVANIVTAAMIYIALHAVLRTEFMRDSVRQLKILLRRR